MTATSLLFSRKEVACFSGPNAINYYCYGPNSVYIFIPC